jgi:hypothetical protein
MGSVRAAPEAFAINVPLYDVDDHDHPIQLRHFVASEVPIAEPYFIAGILALPISR